MSLDTLVQEHYGVETQPETRPENPTITKTQELLNEYRTLVRNRNPKEISLSDAKYRKSQLRRQLKVRLAPSFKMFTKNASRDEIRQRLLFGSLTLNGYMNTDHTTDTLPYGKDSKENFDHYGRPQRVQRRKTDPPYSRIHDLNKDETVNDLYYSWYFGDRKNSPYFNPGDYPQFETYDLPTNNDWLPTPPNPSRRLRYQRRQLRT